MHENTKKDFVELSKSYFELQKENARLRDLLSKLGISDIPYSCPFAGQIYVKPCPFCGATPGPYGEDGHGGPRMLMISDDVENVEEWTIVCDCGCTLDSLDGESPKELWERWNRRAAN